MALMEGKPRAAGDDVAILTDVQEKK